MMGSSIQWIFILIIISLNCIKNDASLTTQQKVQHCMRSLNSARPLIIDTDADIDDLWAILYLLNEPTINVLAITAVRDGYSRPFYSASNILRFLDLIGCGNRIPVADGLSFPSLLSGFVPPATLLGSIDTYLTSPTCLNQSASDIFIQPSPFEAVELIKLILKYSPKPVDILALGPMTNIAAAIIEDRSIIPKIGTLYFSGGQFKSTTAYPSLIPDLQAETFPYTSETPQTSPNVFLDILAVQRVGASGIKNFAAMPSLTQIQLPVNLIQLNSTLEKLNITLTPFVYKLISSLARCSNQPENEICWWDNSAAQFMIQLQSKDKKGFCTEIKTVKSLYVLAADSYQLFGQGMTDVEQQDPSVQGLPDYRICTETDSNIFLIEFLTKIHSNKLYSCKKTFSQRFDFRLQKCLKIYGLDK